METTKNHRSGFVNIIGKPNVGKSTLMNALVGERMSIITNKPQTTRHRIIGLLSGDDFQIVFSDTPGIIDNPTYGMQKAMNRFARSTFEDADIMLFVLDVNERYPDDDPVIEQLKNVKVPLFLLINKIDKVHADKVEAVRKIWTDRVDFSEIHEISALHKTGTDQVLDAILKRLPEGPAYYPKDQLTDRPERFFVSEIIREKILELYHQEIPYSTEVIIESFKETETNKGEPLTRISAIIFVSRKTQKPIIIGKEGKSIKKLGTEARKSLEKWLEMKVFLELHVKIKEDWRDDDRQLKWLGYS
ncbi:MAG: GTPase Era [Bacteroidetes bacterium]|nr:GTPase Era [Bacteroidota bacterium]